MSYFEIDNFQTQLLLVFIILFISWSVLRYLQTPKNLPPGPWGLPIFGYRFFLGKKPPITIANMRKKYGDLIRINMGNEEVIFLTSFNAIREAFIKQANNFSAKSEKNVHTELEEAPGIIRSNGEMWSQLRRFSLSKLRDLGFGKSSLEPQLKDEIQYFLKELDSFEGQPITNMAQILRKTITNVICVIITGKRFDYNHKVFNHLLDLSKEHFSRTGIDKVLTLIPKPFRFKALLNILGIKSPAHTAVDMLNVISAIVDEFDAKHEAGNEDNFIDAWLTESKKNKAENKYITKKQLLTVVLDLFLGGSDTTTNTLGWSLLYMIEHSDIQAKVQEEIENIIGNERTPSMSDQKLMPYTEAVLMELHRIVTIAPLVNHCGKCDTVLLGKFIPKGMSVIPNFWAVHHDPEYFPDPDKFNPERFLTDDGQIKRIEELIPFSMGKRQCLGESLARMETFLCFTSMLQHFTFKKVNETVDFDFDFGVVTVPKPQPICAISRNI